jgi:hypothetical protein
MASVALRFERTGSRQIDQLQRELAAALSVLLACPFATGKAIRAISLTSGVSVSFAHGLGYVPANVIPILAVASAAHSVVTVSRDAVQVTVQANGSMIVDFWVS